MDITTDEAYGHLMGTGVPLLISLVLRPTWSNRKRMMISLLITWAVSVLWKLLTWGVQGVFNEPITITPQGVADFIMFVLLNLIVCLVTYATIWKPSGVPQTIEANTSPTNTPDQQEAVAELRAEAERMKTPPRTATVPIDDRVPRPMRTSHDPTS